MGLRWVFNGVNVRVEEEIEKIRNEKGDWREEWALNVNVDVEMTHDGDRAMIHASMES